MGTDSKIHGRRMVNESLNLACIKSLEKKNSTSSSNSEHGNFTYSGYQLQTVNHLILQ